MSRPARLALILIAFAVVCPCPAAAAKQTLPRTNRKVVQRCGAILKKMTDTKYQHRTHVETRKGVYHVDCSGFLCHLLGRHWPKALDAVPIEPGVRRQRAITFYKAFASAPAEPGGHWRAVRRMEDALPGDFFSWRKKNPQKGNSGHCGIIWKRPVREPDGSFRVRILDSTTTGHDDDRRIDPKVTGLALGTMWFVVNDQGEPIGYRWSSRSKKTVLCQTAVGRLNGKAK